MKLLKALGALLVVALIASPAFAGPLPYYNQPLDTPNSAANAVVSSINGASGVPTASVLQTGTDASNAVTLNATKGTVTTESLTTAAAATFTSTLTDSTITAASQVYVSVGLGTSTTGVPVLSTVAPAAGSVVIKILNAAASAAFNGTLTYSFLVVN